MFLLFMYKTIESLSMFLSLQVKIHKDFNIYLPQRKMDVVRTGSPNRMVRDILTTSFTRNYLASHSVGGFISNAYRQRPPKPAIPTNFLDALTGKYWLLCIFHVCNFDCSLCLEFIWLWKYRRTVNRLQLFICTGCLLYALCALMCAIENLVL